VNGGGGAAAHVLRADHVTRVRPRCRAPTGFFRHRRKLRYGLHRARELYARASRALSPLAHTAETRPRVDTKCQTKGLQKNPKLLFANHRSPIPHLSRITTRPPRAARTSSGESTDPKQREITPLVIAPRVPPHIRGHTARVRSLHRPCHAIAASARYYKRGC
jgi:hypothetical protein